MIDASYVEARDASGEYLYQVFHHEVCWPIYDTAKREWTTAWGGPIEWERCGESSTNGKKFNLPLYRNCKTRVFTELDLSRLHVAEECPLYSQRREKSKTHYLEKKRRKAAKYKESHPRKSSGPIGHAWRGHAAIFGKSKFETDADVM